MLPFLKLKKHYVKEKPSPKKDIITYQVEETKNKLECIVLMITSNEINNGSFNTFIKQFDEVYNIDLLIFINNKNHINFDDSIQSLKTKFNNVIIHYANILPIEDVYIRIVENKFPQIPKYLKYGSASGPNIQFFETIKYCQKYNTIILLETDCILFNNWFDKINLYIEHCGDFLISGSTYDGNDAVKPMEDIGMFLHLNGVALYKTSSPNLQLLIELLKDYIENRVKWGFKITSYDWLISQMIIDNLNSIENSLFWRLVYKNIIKNTLIVNLSTQINNNTPLEYILKYYPSCVILHKKTLAT